MKNSNNKNSQNQKVFKTQKLVVKVDSEILFKSGIIRSMPERTYYLGKFPKAPDSWQICISRTHPGGSTSFLLTGIHEHRGIFEAAMVELALEKESFELAKSVFHLKPVQDEKAVERMIYDALAVHSSTGRPLPPELETGLYILQYAEQEVQEASLLSAFQKRTERRKKYMTDNKQSLKNNSHRPNTKNVNRHHSKSKPNVKNAPKSPDSKNLYLPREEQEAINSIFGKPLRELNTEVIDNAVCISNVPLPKAVTKAVLDAVRAGNLSSEKIREILSEQMLKNEKRPGKSTGSSNYTDDQVSEPVATYSVSSPESPEMAISGLDEVESADLTGNGSNNFAPPHQTDSVHALSMEKLSDIRMTSAKTGVLREASYLVNISLGPLSADPINIFARLNRPQGEILNPDSRACTTSIADTSDGPLTPGTPPEEASTLSAEPVADPDDDTEPTAKAALLSEAGKATPEKENYQDEGFARTFGAYLNLGLNHGAEVRPEDYTRLAQRLIKRFPAVFDFKTSIKKINNSLTTGIEQNNSEQPDTALSQNKDTNIHNAHKTLRNLITISRKGLEAVISELSEEKKREAIEALGPDIPSYDPHYCDGWSIYDWRRFLDEDRTLEHSQSLLAPAQFHPLMYLFRAWVKAEHAHAPTIKELQQLKTHPAILSERQVLSQDYKPSMEEIEFQFEICTEFAAAASLTGRQQAIRRLEAMLEKFPENPFFWSRLQKFHLEMNNEEQAFRSVCRRYNTSKDRQGATAGYFAELYRAAKTTLLKDFLKDTVLFEKQLANPPHIYNEQYYHQYYRTLALHFASTHQWQEFATLVDLFHEQATSRNDTYRKKFWHLLYSEAVFFMNEVLHTLNSKRELKDVFLDCLYPAEELEEEEVMEEDEVPELHDDKQDKVEETAPEAPKTPNDTDTVVEKSTEIPSAPPPCPSVRPVTRPSTDKEQKHTDNG